MQAGLRDAAGAEQVGPAPMTEDDLDHERARVARKLRLRPRVLTASAQTGRNVAAPARPRRSRSATAPRRASRRRSSTASSPRSSRPRQPPAQAGAPPEAALHGADRRAAAALRIQVNSAQPMTRDYAYFLENRLRARYGLDGVPLIIDFAERKHGAASAVSAPRLASAAPRVVAAAALIVAALVVAVLVLVARGGSPARRPPAERPRELVPADALVYAAPLDRPRPRGCSTRRRARRRLPARGRLQREPAARALAAPRLRRRPAPRAGGEEPALALLAAARRRRPSRRARCATGQPALAAAASRAHAAGRSSRRAIGRPRRRSASRRALARPRSPSTAGRGARWPTSRLPRAAHGLPRAACVDAWASPDGVRRLLAPQGGVLGTLGPLLDQPGAARRGRRARAERATARSSSCQRSLDACRRARRRAVRADAR